MEVLKTHLKSTPVMANACWALSNIAVDGELSERRRHIWKRKRLVDGKSKSIYRGADCGDRRHGEKEESVTIEG